MTEAPESLNTLLHQIAQGQKLCDYDLNVKEISTGGANYTSKLFTVTITEGKHAVNLFAKVAAIGEKFRSQAPRVYETERFVYTELVNIYKSLEDEHQIPEEHRLHFPKFYGCDPVPFQETIVLENLLVTGYNEYDRFKSIDWAYASSAMKELGKMHALALAFGKYQPEEFEDVAKKLKFDWNSDDESMKLYLSTVITRALPLITEGHRGKLETFFADFSMDTMMKLYQATKQQAVLGHGDFRPSNLMHRNLDDGTVDIKIVDLQTMQAGSPVVDLLYFIFTGSDEEFRSEYYDKLIDYYYEQLSAAMKRLHLIPDELYSRADFDYELEQKLPFGLSIAVFALPIVTVETENAPKVDEEMDIASFSIQKTSNLYADRLNGVVNDYVKWGLLK